MLHNSQLFRHNSHKIYSIFLYISIKIAPSVRSMAGAICCYSVLNVPVLHWMVRRAVCFRPSIASMPSARPLGSSSIPAAPATAPTPINSVQNSRMRGLSGILNVSAYAFCP